MQHSYNTVSEALRLEDLKNQLNSKDGKYPNYNLTSHMKWHLNKHKCLVGKPSIAVGNDIESPAMQKIIESETKYSILLCTDFVAPKLGGVETHSY